ncbi:hypothetical protein GBA52_003595, partial [Prunus armeniaca]
VYGARGVNKENKSSQPPYTITNGYDLQTPIHLQLSQPQNQTQPRLQNNEIPSKGIKLGTPILYALPGMISTPMNLPQPLKAPMHDAWTSASALQLLQYILSSSATFFFYKIYHYRES